jgi:hypothetical protein
MVPKVSSLRVTKVSQRDPLLSNSLLWHSELLGFWTLSIIWYTKEHSVLEAGSVSALKWQGVTHLLCWVHWKELTSVTGSIILRRVPAIGDHSWATSTWIYSKPESAMVIFRLWRAVEMLYLFAFECNKCPVNSIINLIPFVYSLNCDNKNIIFCENWRYKEETWIGMWYQQDWENLKLSLFPILMSSPLPIPILFRIFNIIILHISK